METDTFVCNILHYSDNNSKTLPKQHVQSAEISKGCCCSWWYVVCLDFCSFEETHGAQFHDMFSSSPAALHNLQDGHSLGETSQEMGHAAALTVY